MKKKIKTAIAGYGVVGKKRHFYLKQNPNFSVVAICDQNKDNFDTKYHQINFFESYKKLLSMDLDAVFICMSNDMAAEVTIAFLKNNINVFCEKPPARNLKELKKVIIQEKKNPNIKLMYGFNHRYHDSVQEALKIIKSNKLGKIINIKGSYGKSQLITFNQTTWRTKRSIAGGGVLLDQGIHIVDLIRLFIGEIIEVKSFISNNFWKFDVEDNAYAILRTSKNVYAIIHSSATQWRHRFNLEINLTKGSLILEGILSGSKNYGEEKLTIVQANPLKDNGNPKEKIIKYVNDPSWKKEIQNFADILFKKKTVVPSSSRDAVNCMKVIYDIYSGDKNWKKKFNIEKTTINL